MLSGKPWSASVQHKHIKRTRQIIDTEGRAIFVIETDLVTDPTEKGFDATAYRDLEKSAHEYLKKHPNYEDFRIRARKGSDA
jgi:hypothetical protein